MPCLYVNNLIYGRGLVGISLAKIIKGRELDLSNRSIDIMIFDMSVLALGFDFNLLKIHITDDYL